MKINCVYYTKYLVYNIIGKSINPLMPNVFHIVQGPYKQFKGKSRNTGPITLVLYEDPPDAIPKIHVM